MSRSRFGALLALAAVVVAAGGFLLGLAIFDDGEPDSPPAAASGDDGGETTADGGAETTTTTAPAAEVRTEALPSPSWIVVITSEDDEAQATAVAGEVAGDGHPSGVLRSDEYQSLNPGFWVSYAGPYPDGGAAAEAAATITAEGRSGVYVRCAGTQPDCNPGGGGGEGEGNGGNGGDDDDDD